MSALEQRSTDPALWDDPEAARKLMQRLADTKAVVDTWQRLLARATEVAELADLTIAEGDSSLEKDIRQEGSALEEELRKRELELVFTGPYDERTALLAVHAGAGGTESQDWAEMLLRMYLRWAERNGYATQILDQSPGE
ncbi:MAG: PCRF domain-containing protein, partial [Chloroflexi bacterium]|nr:PCRF domain-containing protein [Chloroflexota bacterium]